MALTATVYHVDLTRGTVETKTIPEDVYRKYPGGSALATYLLLHTMPRGADAIAFLLGPDARYVNGHDLVVDGGITGNFLGRLPGISRVTRS